MHTSALRRSLCLLATLLLAVSASGCDSNGSGGVDSQAQSESAQTQTIQISSSSPSTGLPGSPVTLSGQGFQPGAQISLCASSPRVVGRAPVAGAQALAIQDGYALLGTTGGLLSVDVTDPTQPVILGQLDTATDDIVADGFTAYASGGGKLNVISLADPAAPYVIGSCKLPGSPASLAVADGRIYAACSTEGLKVIDVTEPQHPQVLSSHSTPSPATSVAVSGDQAFVTTTGGSFLIYSLKPNGQDKPKLKLVGMCELGTPSWSVTLSGTLAYVAAGEAGLLVVDIAKPKAPQIVGTCDLPGCARAVAISGGLAHVAADEAGLQVVSVTNPTAPRLIESCGTPGACLDVAVSGAYAFLADRNFGWLRQASGSTEPPEATTGLLAVSLNSPSLAFQQAAVVNTSTMTAIVPERGLLGSWDVKITNPDGGTALLPNAFVVSAGNRPQEPSLIGPADQESDVAPDSAVSWTCGASRVVNRFVYVVRIATDAEHLSNSQGLPLGAPELSLADLRAPEFLLHPETTYYWSVSVKDSCGWGSSGPTWSFTTGSYPFVESLSPQSCQEKGELTIHGSGLATGGPDWILLNDKKIKATSSTVTSWTDTDIVLTVPLKYPKTTPAGQTVDVRVQVSAGGKRSNVGHFSLLPAAP